MEDKITILMATFNGEKYIEEQIESIINQTYKNWELIIHDDGSKDKTIDIIKKYTREYSNIILLEDNIVLGNAYKNFMHLTKNVKNTNYVMFSDQDDIWNGDKIEKTLFLMKKKDCDKKPICIFTDYVLFDTNKRMPIKDKHKKQINLSFNYLLTQNIAHGCTIMINKELINLMKKWNYLEYGMHDWTALLIAAYYGEVYYIDIATMMYRMHNNNVLGAEKNFIKWFLTRLSIKENKVRVKGYYNQAKELLKISTRKSKEEIILNNFIFAQECSTIKRYRILKENDCIRGNILKKMGLIFFS